jgi:ABC-2 type transport system ATP-binding protein
MYVQIDALGAEAGPALASIPGVSRVVAADGGGSFEIESEHGTDIRRELARTVVNNGWGLLELRPMRMSLEEIFLQVTTDEAAPDEARPASPVIDDTKQEAAGE